MFEFLKRKPSFPKLKFFKRLPGKLRGSRKHSHPSALAALTKDKDGDTGHFFIEENEDNVTQNKGVTAPVTIEATGEPNERAIEAPRAAKYGQAVREDSNGTTSPLESSPSSARLNVGASDSTDEDQVDMNGNEQDNNKPSTSGSNTNGRATTSSPVLTPQLSGRRATEHTAQTESMAGGSYRVSEGGVGGSYRVSDSGVGGSYRYNSSAGGSYRSGSVRYEDLEAEDDSTTDPDESPAFGEKQTKMTRSSSVRNSFKRFRRKSLNQIDNLRESIRRKSSKTTKATSLIPAEDLSSSTESIKADPIRRPKSRDNGTSKARHSPSQQVDGVQTAGKVEEEEDDEEIRTLERSPTPFRRQFSDRMRRSLKKSGKYLKYSMEGFSAVTTANGLSVAASGGSSKLI